MLDECLVRPRRERGAVVVQLGLHTVDEIAASGLQRYHRTSPGPCFWTASIVMNTGVA